MSIVLAASLAGTLVLLLQRDAYADTLRDRCNSKRSPFSIVWSRLLSKIYRMPFPARYLLESAQVPETLNCILHQGASTRCYRKKKTFCRPKDATRLFSVRIGPPQSA